MSVARSRGLAAWQVTWRHKVSMFIFPRCQLSCNSSDRASCMQQQCPDCLYAVFSNRQTDMLLLLQRSTLQAMQLCC